MKQSPFIENLRQLTVSITLENHPSRTVGRLATRDRAIFFEYDRDFLSSGWEISPFRLPLSAGVTTGDPQVFQGLMGAFEDSLPDGWGRLLLDRKIAQMGFSPLTLHPLTRLAFIGSHAMGALRYEPDWNKNDKKKFESLDLDTIASDVKKILADSDTDELERLILLGGSPQGARPKALIQLSLDEKKILFGTAPPQPGYLPYMVKFNAKGDPPHASVIEHVYTQTAKLAGIEVPETRLLGRSKKNPGYFAIQRFDRKKNGEKFHLHTLSGLLHAPHQYPAIGYRELLLVTRQLTRDESCVEQMFRRACFNVWMHNRDDHSRNFSFLMNAQGQWRPSPAYDLTDSDGPGGEHMMSIAGEGRHPTQAHLKKLGSEIGLKNTNQLMEEVRAGLTQFKRIADQAGLPKNVRNGLPRFL